MGEEYFYSCEEYEYLHDIPFPPFFLYEFNVFIEIYNMSGGMDGMTWKDIQAWEYCRNTKLKQCEIDVILKIHRWANQTIEELQNFED